MFHLKKSQRGFTLIELLIVVAIIAILAAIAVPNFLEAQVRAKISRCHNDMRAIATALESYKIDANRYPPDAQFFQIIKGIQLSTFGPDWCVLSPLTTPIAYMTSIPFNVFEIKNSWWDGNPMYYAYKAEDSWISLMRGWNPDLPQTSILWVLTSCGPNQQNNRGTNIIFGEDHLNTLPGGDWGGPGCLYDPTNGTISPGDIVRVGP